MGKLNIAHHKSYHPYRRDNIERVRKDEEEAQLEEAKAEGKMMLADSEARMDLLRQRAGITENKKKTKRKEEKDELKLLESSVKAGGGAISDKVAELPTTNGHINLFQDLEQGALLATAAAVNKKKPAAETEKGVALAPSAKDLKPWYSKRASERDVELETTSSSATFFQSRKRDEEADEEEEGIRKRRRDEERKTIIHDPLYSISRQLASRNASSSSSEPSTSRAPRPPPDDPKQARLSRESAERQRALDLIKRRKREMAGMGNATPTTVDDDPDSGYKDVFNRREVDEAHRVRNHGQNGWEGGRRWGSSEGRSDRNRTHHGPRSKY